MSEWMSERVSISSNESKTTNFCLFEVLRIPSFQSYFIHSTHTQHPAHILQPRTPPQRTQPCYQQHKPYPSSTTGAVVRALGYRLLSIKRGTAARASFGYPVLCACISGVGGLFPRGHELQCARAGL